MPGGQGQLRRGGAAALLGYPRVSSTALPCPALNHTPASSHATPHHNAPLQCLVEPFATVPALMGDAAACLPLRQVFIGEVSDSAVACRDVQQRVAIMRQGDKQQALAAYLQGLPTGARVMVFCQRKVTADEVQYR